MRRCSLQKCLFRCHRLHLCRLEPGTAYRLRPLCVVGRWGRKKKRERGVRWEGKREKYPNKNSKNRKMESARRTMGRGKRLEHLFSLSSSHPAPFFLSPASVLSFSIDDSDDSKNVTFKPNSRFFKLFQA